PEAAPGQVFRIDRVRTASSAACPGESRQRATRNSMSLESTRMNVVVGNPARLGQTPRFSNATPLPYKCAPPVPVSPGLLPLFRNSYGQKLAAMCPRSFHVERIGYFRGLPRT